MVLTAKERLTATGKKKLLALDGGGIRGAMTVEVLASIEKMLREQLKKPDLVLGDYFDYIGGTSTGAIIAATLACGMSTDELRKFYEQSGKEMFDKSSVLRRFQQKYKGEALRTPTARRLWPGHCAFVRPPSHSVADGHAECHDRLAVAHFE